MTKRMKGDRVVKGLDQMSLGAVYPPVPSEINLNTCADPDCGNYGVTPDFARSVFKGPNAAERKLPASAADPALSISLGHYTMTSDDKRERISDVFEYDGDPRVWSDGRDIICHHQRGNGATGQRGNGATGQRGNGATGQRGMWDLLRRSFKRTFFG